MQGGGGLVWSYKAGGNSGTKIERQYPSLSETSEYSYYDGENVEEKMAWKIVFMRDWHYYISYLNMQKKIVMVDNSVSLSISVC